MNFKQHLIKDAIYLNLENSKSLLECIFRVESTGFIEYFKYLKEHQNSFDLKESELEVLNTNIGEKSTYEGSEVFLDLPYINEKYEDVELNKPKRNTGEGKKYYVYVKNDKGNVIKVQFGDEKGGLTAKINNPGATKAFVARHDCKNKTDKTTAGYWSCRLPKYASLLGLKGGGDYYW